MMEPAPAALGQAAVARIIPSLPQSLGKFISRASELWDPLGFHSFDLLTVPGGKVGAWKSHKQFNLWTGSVGSCPRPLNFLAISECFFPNTSSLDGVKL